jgi:ABC-2 type transport system permease protein/oleandomycin transport system permease protein
MTTITDTRAAVVPTPRPVSPSVGLGQGISHTITMAWRNLAQIRHNPMELGDLSIQPIMFVLLFTYVFGGAIGGNTTTYLQFMLPGMIVQNALFAMMNTAIGLNTDITKGVYDRFRALPIARSAPLAGRILADSVRQVWSFLVILIVGMVIGFRIETGVPETLAAIGVLIAFGMLFSWFPVFIGLTASEPEKVMTFGFVLIMPLTFTANVFVRTDTMPGWLRAWSEVNPVTYLSDAMRGLLSGGPVLENALWAGLWALGIAVVFAPLSIRALRKRS